MGQVRRACDLTKTSLSKAKRSKYQGKDLVHLCDQMQYQGWKLGLALAIKHII